MSFVEQVFLKPAAEVTIGDLETLIQDRREEDQNLEYKGSSILRSSQRLSASVSAFLNAEGGLLILGISEETTNGESLNAKIFPSALELVPREYTVERISQLVHSNIRADVGPTIRISPVRHSVGSDSAFLLEIPPGEHPPYQASDDRYYRRVNSIKYPLRHYEIADFFNRRRAAHLAICVRPTASRSQDGRWLFDADMFLTNSGRASAKHAQVVLSFMNAEIINSQGRSLVRLDAVRSGIASLQWRNDAGLVYASREDYQRFAQVESAANEDAIFVGWEVLAEDAEKRSGMTELRRPLLEKALNEGVTFIEMTDSASQETA